MKRVQISLLCLVLTGCAATPMHWRPQAMQLMSQGKCSEARQLLQKSEPDIAIQTTYIGVIYGDCDKNRQEAFRHFTLGARYGNQVARDILVKYNRPVPSPDLAARASPADSTSGAAALLGVANSVIEGRNAARAEANRNAPREIYLPPSRDITCESRSSSLGPGLPGTVTTNCR